MKKLFHLSVCLLLLSISPWPVFAKTNPNAHFNESGNSPSINLSILIDAEISCHGMNDAIIQATALPAGAYTYTCLHPTASPTTNTSGNFLMLETGTHTVIATDGTCTVSETVTFVDPDPLDIVFTTDSMVSCLGNDGRLSISVSGGTANIQPYLTFWTNIANPGVFLNNITTNNYADYLDNLPAGNYNVKVEDDHGCFYNETASIEVAPPINVSAFATPIICYGGTTVIQLSGNGGVSYAPSYASTLSFTINNAAVTSSYGVGTYTIQAKDAKGCSADMLFQLFAPPNLSDTSNIIFCNVYLWHGSTYTASGQYTYTFMNNDGCTHTSVLNLIIRTNTSSTLTVGACNTYTWVNGMTYTMGGTYTATLINAAGCDSLMTLNLTMTNGVNLALKAMLSGAYNESNGLMRDDLRTLNLIPLTPLNTFVSRDCFSQILSFSINNNILSVSGPNAIVDWVLVEIRDGSNGGNLITSSWALIQRDGDIVSNVNGSSPLYFQCLCPGNYYVCIKHRNHLGIMTGNPIALSSTLQTFDFSNPASNVYTRSDYPSIISNLPRQIIGSKACMWGGDANTSKASKYNGSANDREQILTDLGGNPNAVLFPVYKNTDLNMDGTVRYNGLNNDKNWLLDLINLSTSPSTTNTRISQHTP